MTIRKLFPQGKPKAFNITYDDGVEQDIRFLELLNRYRLKGTFNLNSALMETQFQWIHENGQAIRRLASEVAATLYEGHEIASHTLSHPYMDNLSKEEILHQLSADKQNLEALFSQEIKGFAVPFYYYSDLIAQCAKECGFTYARISEESGSFAPQRDYFHWQATVFHCSDALEGLTHRFLENQEELAIFQIVGHSYDLDVEEKWDFMERLFALISAQEEILPMTTIQIIEYLQAMEHAEISPGHIQNNSQQNLWFSIDGAVVEVKPSAGISLL